MEIPEELYTDSMVTEEQKIPVKIVNRRISNGTRNLAKEAAMTREEAAVSYTHLDVYKRQGQSRCDHPDRRHCPLQDAD